MAAPALAAIRTSPSQSTLECLAKLISFDTTSRNSNLALIDWAAELLETAGATLHYDYNAERSKANLIATFGEGPGGVVLSGHTDVVPVDGQVWTSDPFTATIRDGRLYGRGACDMKAYLGVVLARTERFAQASAQLREPIHIALSYDEELGCLGISALLAAMQAAGIAPSGCIVGEPTQMRLVAAHKGGRVYRCRVTGCAAHSSLTPNGLNAVEYAARIVSKIQDLAEQHAAQGPFDAAFDVPFSTISTNTIEGGSGINIVPAQCEFSFEYRYLPGVAPQQFIDQIEQYANHVLLPKMRARNARGAIAFECIGSIPALDSHETDAINRLAVALLGERRGLGDGQSAKVGYGTEAGFFQQLGVPSLVCGPGSIEQAHKPDEYVSLAQLALCESFIDGLVERMTSA